MTEGEHADVSSTVVRAFVGEIVLVFRINERIVAHIHLTTVLVVLSVLLKSPKATRRRNLSLCKVKVMRMEFALARDLGREVGGSRAILSHLVQLGARLKIVRRECNLYQGYMSAKSIPSFVVGGSP